MCPGLLLSSSSLAPGISIIPISDVTGLGGEEPLACRGHEDRGLQPGGWEAGRAKEGGQEPLHGCALEAFRVRRQRLITANFLPLARTTDPQGFHSIFVYLALSARLP